MEVLVAGDFLPHHRVKEILRDEQYSIVFPKQLVSIVRAVDFSFVNLECPIIDKGYSPIIKCGRNFGCTSHVLSALRYLGFTGVTLANNHILDYGEDGVKNTINHCTLAGMTYTGAGMNANEASKTLYVRKDNQTLAIINCCEQEFSIASDRKAGANHLNPVRQYYAIKEAKHNADYVVVIAHGGHEHFQLPSLRMQELYRFFIDSGADVVINHHQHCFSGYEVYNEKPIFYGIGNFCFDMPSDKSSMWNFGYLVQLSLDKEISFNIYPFSQCVNDPTVEILDKSAFDDEIARLNSIILDKSRLKEELDIYYKDTRKYIAGFIEPISNRLIKAAQKRKLLPSLVSKGNIPSIYNAISCESHRDRLLYYLQSELNKMSKE